MFEPRAPRITGIWRTGGGTLGADDEARLRADLETFTANLVKSVLQTSVFRTDHELTHKAVDAFLESVAALGDRFQEISYVAASIDTKPEINLEGVLPEPIPLRTCLRSALRDEFISKLHDFFGWNRLVSLSIRREVKRAELIKFLEVTTRTPSAVPAAAGGLDRSRLLSDILLENDIVHISVVSREELSFGERVVPWRVRLALSRLRKSLKNIPMFSKATVQQIQEAKLLLIRDIVRPLQSRELAVELMVNCDVVETKGTEMEGMDMEWAVANAFVRPRLLIASSCLVDELGRPPGPGEQDKLRRDSALRVLKKCLGLASYVLDRECVALIREVQGKGLVAEEELPENVREYLRISQIADRFLGDPDGYLRQLTESRDVASFRAHASTSALLAGELIQRREYRWVGAVIDALWAHAAGTTGAAPDMQELARQCLELVNVPENVARMLADLGEVDEAAGRRIVEVLGRLGEQAVSTLIDALGRECPGSTRAAIRRVIEMMGARATGLVRTALRAEHQRWEQCRDLLMVLGRFGDPADHDLACSFRGHLIAEVREAAYETVGRAGAPAAEGVLLEGLRDSDLDVRSTVVSHLGGRGCRAEEFVRFVVDLFTTGRGLALSGLVGDLVRGKLARTRRARLRLLASSAMALGKLVDAGAVVPGEMQRSLARTLNRHVPREPSEGGGPIAAERAVLCVAIIGILRTSGTETALKALGRARRSPDRGVSFAAASAAHEIMTRTRTGKAPPGRAGLVRWLRVKLGRSRAPSVK